MPQQTDQKIDYVEFPARNFDAVQAFYEKHYVPENIQLVVGMSSFGASAPYDKLYSHFGITAAAIAERVRRIV